MSELEKLHLAMVPGTQCNHRLWERLIPSLSSQIQPLHVAIEQCATRAQMLGKIDDAFAVAEHLLGFSMGGYLALQYALANPGKVRSLVLIASSAFGLSDAEKKARQAMLAFLQTHTYSGMSTSRLREFIAQDRWQDQALISVIRSMDKSLGGATLLNQVQQTSERQDLTPSLGTLTCRVLIIAAKEDTKVAVTDLTKMASLIPNAELAVFEGCGHMVPLEQPEALAERLHQFYLSM